MKENEIEALVSNLPHLQALKFEESYFTDKHVLLISIHLVNLKSIDFGLCVII